LSDDFYVHDEKAHALVGRRKRKVYRLGAKMRVVIKEADGITGSCIFAIAPGQGEADIEGMDAPDAGGDTPRNRRGSGGSKQGNKSQKHKRKAGHAPKPKRKKHGKKSSKSKKG